MRARRTARRRRSPAPAACRQPSGGTALGSQLESIERDAIIKALEKTRYNKTAAAKLLGHELSRAALPDQEAGDRIGRTAGDVTVWVTL